MFIVRWFNSLSRLLLGVGVMDFFKKVSDSKQAFERAMAQAQKHKYLDALNIAEEVLDIWYTPASANEQKLRQWFADDLLKKIKQQLAEWEPKADDEYKAAKERAYWLASEGRFEEAIALFEPVHQRYYEPEARKFINEVYQVIAGKKSFKLGLFAEQAGDFATALSHYQNAVVASTCWEVECRIRMGIIAIKTQDWQKAYFQVKDINTKQATYIKGFICAQQGDWQSCKLEWQTILSNEVKPERFSERDLKKAKYNIQELVEKRNLKQAKIESQNFLIKYGEDEIVRANLEKNIQPRLELELWRQHPWQHVDVAEQQWLEKLDITALHNWALVAYHQVQTNTNLDLYDELIIAWSTAIANLHLNPLLQNIPWMGDVSVDLEEVSQQLLQKLEVLINSIEDQSERYQQFYELYRLETEALRLIGTPAKQGVRVKGLFITPGCYHRYRHQIKFPPLPGKLWATLYTDWYSAVLACLKGDYFKAKELKPKTEPVSEAEKFAQRFVSYHEGCYYLEIETGGYPRWRSAVAPLRLAKSEIRASKEWCVRVEELCKIHYQAVAWNQDERREFARFWYEILESSTAKYYIDNDNLS
jgi:tetratricopeptide (TPR) repeat protein